MTDKLLSSFFFFCVVVKHSTILGGINKLWSQKCYILGVYVCLYSCFIYAALKSHLFCAALYCHLWRIWLYVFLHYLINSTILRKRLLIIKCVFRVSLQLLCETFLILRRIQRDIINVLRSSCQVPVILVRFYGDLDFPDRFSKRRSDIRFHENPSCGGTVLCGQTVGQTWRS